MSSRSFSLGDLSVLGGSLSADFDETFEYPFPDTYPVIIAVFTTSRFSETFEFNTGYDDATATRVGSFISPDFNEPFETGSGWSGT